MKNHELTIYLTLAPTLNGYGDVIGVKIAATHLSRPAEPKGVVVAVTLKVPESVVCPSVTADLSNESTIFDLKSLHDSL